MFFYCLVLVFNLENVFLLASDGLGIDLFQEKWETAKVIGALESIADFLINLKLGEKHFCVILLERTLVESSHLFVFVRLFLIEKRILKIFTIISQIS